MKENSQLKQNRKLIIFLTIFGLGITLAGILMIKRAQESLYWPVADGVIVASHETSYVEKGKIRRYADVKYSFKVNGEEYIASGITYKDLNRPINETLAKYPVGRKVKVYYNPDDPVIAVLEPGATWESYQGFVLGILILIVDIGVIVYYKRKDMNVVAKSDNPIKAT